MDVEIGEMTKMRVLMKKKTLHSSKYLKLGVTSIT